MKLRPYQREAIDAVRAVYDDGVQNALVVLATGLGKALRNDQRVLRPDGAWTPICELRVGDFVVGRDGRPTAVVGVYPQGNRPMFSVETNDGAVVVCDEDHMWSVRTKYDKRSGAPWRTLTLRQIVAAGVECQAGRRWELPSVSPVEHPSAGLPFHPTAGLPLDPYLLGVLLGDGGLSVEGRILITAEHDLVATLHQYIPPPCTLKFLAPAGNAGTYYLGGPTGRGANPVLSAVRVLGLDGHTAHTKFVPDCYIFAPAIVRLGVLQGLMDTDGHVRKDGHVEITLASQRLAEGVQALVRSLGGRARLREKKTTWKHKGERRTGVAWRVSVALAICPFRWKASRWTPRVKYDAARRIESVTPAGEAEATCIKVAAEDGLFVTEGYVVTHNTVLFCALGREMRTEGVGKVLVLAHRDELLTQARDKWLAVDPSASVGIYQGDRREAWADVIFASVQSCYPDVLAEDGVTVKRKGRIHELPLSEIGLVVVDECHRLPAPTYGAIIASIREANPAALLLGVTATPARADGKGLGMYFDRVAYRMGIAEGIEQGYLAPVRGARVELQIDLSQVKTSKRTGDYDDEDLGRVLDTDSAREHIVAKWLDLVGPGTEDGGEHGRFTASFSPTVAAAEHLAAEFERAGVRAGFVSGATKKKDRKRTLDAYQRGDIRVLCNVGVLTEGWDAPHTACVLMARPTKSGVLYRQAVGRGTRMAPGKTDCVVMDCVGANALGLQTILDLSTPGADRVPGIDPEPEEELVLDEGAQTDLDLGEEVEVRRVVGASVYEIDLFGGGVQWVRVNGCSVVTIDIGKALIVFPDVGDTRSVAIVQGRDVDYVVRRVPPKDAFRAGESVAMEIGVPRFLRPSAFYCRKPASEKQITFMRTLVEITAKIAPIDLSAMPAPETQGAHQIQAWITYLNARLAIARAKAPPRVAAPV